MDGPPEERKPWKRRTENCKKPENHNHCETAGWLKLEITQGKLGKESALEFPDSTQRII